MISHIKIFGHGGGALENRKYFDGLKTYAENTNAEFKVISLDEKISDSFDVAIKKTRIADISSRLLGHSTYIYIIWKKIKRNVYEYNPDVVLLGRSRMGFIAKDIKKNLGNCYVITNMENVEYDYVDAYFAHRKGIKKKLLSVIEKYGVYNDEKNAVYYSDAINYLTERDKIRTYNLYKNDKQQETILPVCINHAAKLTIKNGIKNVVFIGSLDYGSNVDALTWFINEVWNVYYSKVKDIQFIVGGSNPTKELITLVRGTDNIKMYRNFNTLEDIIPERALIIAPIQNGAGMKVKVAETLSMGLLIAASDEALVGYEEAISSSISEGIIRANSIEDYLKAINKYRELSDNELVTIEKNNLKLYYQFYSYNRSRKTISEVLQKISRRV